MYRFLSSYSPLGAVDITEDDSKQDQILLVKIDEYKGFCDHRRSCLLGTPVIVREFRWKLANGETVTTRLAMKRTERGPCRRATRVVGRKRNLRSRVWDEMREGTDALH